MNEEQILNALEDLSKSQGFYGRLLSQINGSPSGKQFLKQLAEQQFKDIVDLVLYLES